VGEGTEREGMLRLKDPSTLPEFHPAGASSGAAVAKHRERLASSRGEAILREEEKERGGRRWGLS
jgi:hypothetical protein